MAISECPNVCPMTGTVQTYADSDVRVHDRYSADLHVVYMYITVPIHVHEGLERIDPETHIFFLSFL